MFIKYIPKVVALDHIVCVSMGKSNFTFCNYKLLCAFENIQNVLMNDSFKIISYFKKL